MNKYVWSMQMQSFLIHILDNVSWAERGERERVREREREGERTEFIVSSYSKRLSDINLLSFYQWRLYIGVYTSASSSTGVNNQSAKVSPVPLTDVGLIPVDTLEILQAFFVFWSWLLYVLTQGSGITVVDRLASRRQRVDKHAARRRCLYVQVEESAYGQRSLLVNRSSNLNIWNVWCINRTTNLQQMYSLRLFESV